MIFVYRLSTSAHHVLCVQIFHPTRGLLSILTWGGVWCRFLVLSTHTY